MKTITFSNDQLAAVSDALQARIEHLEAVLAGPDEGRNMMFFRDKLDVTRQALEAVKS